MARENSGKLIRPSPSVSASRIIPVSSSAVSLWPSFAIECASSAAVMYPFPSRSNILNSCFSCSSLYADSSSSVWIPGATIARNSVNSTRPLLFVSALWISALSSSELGFRPSDRIKDASSICVRLPSLFRSKDRKIPRRSAICASSSFGRLLVMIWVQLPASDGNFRAEREILGELAGWRRKDQRIQKEGVNVFLFSRFGRTL
ncbi:unnamed protein product [Linum tenue]|uniref:Uncharacterized protein n=1 Tax=Linum tenue TaxID=586396 RepID=A0AAV0KB26_9ROSI|nr:unnamed protein product [Linum tenue]